MPAADHAAAFMRAIIGAPEDMAPRMAYADWLLECGGEADVARGEFIAAQLRLAEAPPCFGKRHQAPAASAGATTCSLCHPFVEVKSVSDGRLFTHGPDWASPLWAAMGYGPGSYPKKAKTTGIADGEGWLAAWTWRRGFVEEVRLALSTWESRGPDLVRVAPLLRVTLTDKRPWKTGDGHYRWFLAQDNVANQPQAALPSWLFYWVYDGDQIAETVRRLPEDCTHLYHFDDAAAALAPVSRGCLDWAREQKESGQ